LPKKTIGSIIDLYNMLGFIRSLLVIGIGLGIGTFAYKKWFRKPLPTFQKNITNADKVKNFISTHKRPSYVVVQSFIKDPHSRFSKDIEDIKKIKVQKNENSNYFIELQLFTDETDPTAPLIVQFRFLDKKSENLIKEESLNLN
jgi:hypothetical protein